MLHVPFLIFLVYSLCTQRCLHNFSWWTFQSNLPIAEKSYRLQYALSHKDKGQYLKKNNNHKFSKSNAGRYIHTKRECREREMKAWSQVQGITLTMPKHRKCLIDSYVEKHVLTKKPRNLSRAFFPFCNWLPILHDLFPWLNCSQLQQTRNNKCLQASIWCLEHAQAGAIFRRMSDDSQ